MADRLCPNGDTYLRSVSSFEQVTLIIPVAFPLLEIRNTFNLCLYTGTASSKSHLLDTHEFRSGVGRRVQVHR